MSQQQEYRPISEVPPVTVDALTSYYHAHAHQYIQHRDIDPHALYKLMGYVLEPGPAVDIITHPNTPRYALGEGVQHIHHTVKSLAYDLHLIERRPLTNPEDARKAKLLSGILYRALQDFEAACDLASPPLPETEEHKRYRIDEDQRWVAAMNTPEPYEPTPFDEWGRRLLVRNVDEMSDLEKSCVSE
jgi:hypothetical protein